MNKIQFFKLLGFTDYESKTLEALINKNPSTPKQISQDSKVPQNKLYQILKKFQCLGILSTFLTEPKSYQLINLKTFIDDKIKQKKGELSKLKTHSQKIELPGPRPEATLSLIRGQQVIMNKLAEHNQYVKKEILGVQRNWKIWGRGLREMREIIKRGVKVKMIGVINKETKKRAKEWKSIGCKIRVYNTQFGENPLRFTIFDDEQVRITIGKPEIPNPKDYITIWTSSKPLINILKKQFLDMWKQCETF